MVLSASRHFQMGAQVTEITISVEESQGCEAGTEHAVILHMALTWVNVDDWTWTSLELRIFIYAGCAVPLVT